MEERSNEELMRLAQKDVKGAYDIIYERLYGKFVNVAYKILNNRADAEEAAQQALIAGYINKGKFLFLSKVETWLTRILINKAKDIIRKNSATVKPDGEEAQDVTENREETSAGLEGIDYQAEKKTKLMLMFLEECIKGLPEEEKMSLELREIYKIPYKEIVKVSNERFGHTSLGNIKNKTDSAKKRLKNCVEGKLASYEIILKNKY